MRLLIISCFIWTVASAGPRLYMRNAQSDEAIISVRSDPIDGVSYRLPNNTIPLQYDVSLSTNIHSGEFGFDGVVEIKIKVLELPNEIVVHFRSLTIGNINLLDSDSNLIETNVPHDTEPDVEFLVIKPSASLVINEDYIVEITYNGTLRSPSSGAGFYRSSYQTVDGETRWLATTQFESTDARHAFPCYDEPQIRTPFIIAITHDASYHAISNMPEDTRIDIEGTNNVITTFKATPPVQTYLIAFAVSDFEYVESTAGIIPYQRVFAKPQSIDIGDGALAIDAGVKIIAEYENYLGISYSLPKLDQVAVPDFSAGAMENWGLVTYREAYLLWNPKTGTTSQKEGVIATIAHEYAHQWFGNLISPKWWSYLWLNEGFATLYANFLTSLVYPDDRYMDTFVIDTIQYVMQIDINENTRPMSYYVESPSNIDRLFDSVAYDKSGSVLHMMQNALGLSTWRDGLNNYFTARAYQAAEPADLYAGLQAAATRDNPTGAPNVAAIMTTWETQGGYPLIHVSRNENGITFNQNRFFYGTQTSENIWWVPINYVVGSNPDSTKTTPDLWMEGVKTLTILKETAPKPWNDDDWIVVNVQQTGYYRVNYDDNLWNLLIKQLNSDGYDKIHLLNRAQLVDDSLNLARAAKITYDVPFAIMHYLRNEIDYIPWASANRGLTSLNRYLSGSTVDASYQEFMRTNVNNFYTNLGVDAVDDEPKLNRYARNIAINTACRFSHSACLNETAARLRKVFTDNSPIAPDHVNAIYCNGLRENDDSTFFKMQNKMFKSTVQTERNNIITAMGCSHNSVLLNSFLNLAIIPGIGLTNSEKSRILSAPATTGEVGPHTMITFIKFNYKAVIAISSSYLTTMLSNIASRVASESLYTEFETLLVFLQGNNAITENNMATLKTSASANLVWQSTNMGPIKEFFENAP